MLVLTRKEGEKIFIEIDQEIILKPGDRFCVTVCQVHQSGKVRVGLDFPREMRIIREEISNVTPAQRG